VLIGPCFGPAFSTSVADIRHARAPIVVLLSDGEANVPELKVRRFCEQAIDLG
jgi:hypothetical protein